MPVNATRTITVNTASATATTVTSDAIPLNLFETPFNVSFGVVKSGGGDVTFSVQHTFDNVFDSSVTPTWFTHADVSLKTANIDGNYAYPVRATRITTVSASGSAALAFTVLQAGL